MSYRSAASSEAVDEFLSDLAREQCRAVLYYFAQHSTEVATLDALANFFRNRAQQDADETRIAKYLHHATLPRLTHAGFIEYDARSLTVRYRDTARGEAGVDCVAEQEEGSEWI